MTERISWEDAGPLPAFLEHERLTDWIVERVPGTSVSLARLERGQLVAWGDGKTYFLRFTPKASRAKAEAAP